MPKRKKPHGSLQSLEQDLNKMHIQDQQQTQQQQDQHQQAQTPTRKKKTNDPNINQRMEYHLRRKKIAEAALMRKYKAQLQAQEKKIKELTRQLSKLQQQIQQIQQKKK